MIVGGGGSGKSEKKGVSGPSQEKKLQVQRGGISKHRAAEEKK